MSEQATTVAAEIEPAGVAGRAVEVLDTMMRIHDLCIERPSVVAYLGKIAPENRRSRSCTRSKSGSRS